MTTNENTQTIEASKVVIINVSWGSIGKQRTTRIRTTEEENDTKKAADAGRLKAVKKLYDCPELDAIEQRDGIARRWLTARAFDGVVAKGFYLLPLELLGEVEAYLKNASDERAALVEKFLVVYDRERDAARELLGEYFRPDDYPTDARERFRLSWRYLSLSVPETLPPELMQAEQEKARQAWEAAAVEVRDALRVSFAELLEHLQVSLTPKEDGKKRKFYDSTIENLMQFMELFEKRNITNDAELAALITRARGIIGNTTPEQIRSSRNTRDTLKAKTGEIMRALSSLVETKSARKFNMED